MPKDRTPEMIINILENFIKMIDAVVENGKTIKELKKSLEKSIEILKK